MTCVSLHAAGSKRARNTPHHLCLPLRHRVQHQKVDIDLGIRQACQREEITFQQVKGTMRSMVGAGNWSKQESEFRLGAAMTQQSNQRSTDRPVWGAREWEEPPGHRVRDASARFHHRQAAQPHSHNSLGPHFPQEESLIPLLWWGNYL